MATSITDNWTPDSWKLYLVMKNGRPFKGYIFEDDANECRARCNIEDESDRIEVIPMDGSDLPFQPPPGAIYMQDGVETINLPGVSVKKDDLEDITVFKAF